MMTYADNCFSRRWRGRVPLMVLLGGYVCYIWRTLALV
jgi:hypothetical protein